MKSKGRDFKIMSLNKYRLMKHLDELRVLADHQKPDILAINETKIDDKISDQEIAIDGYYVERRDRNQFGGGVAMYIHNSVEYKIRDDLMNFENECLTIQIKIGMSKPFLVTSLYSPNNTTDHLNKTDSLIACIDTENKESIIIGDTNCDFIKQTNYTTHLKRIIKNHGLTKLIEDPTRNHCFNCNFDRPHCH